MANLGRSVSVSTYLDPNTGLVQLGFGDGLFTNPTGFSNPGVVQDLTAGASVSIGTNPATSLTFRGPTGGGISFRNIANTNNNYIQMANDIFTFNFGGISTPVSIDSSSLSVSGKILAAGTLTAGGLLGNALQVATSGPLIYSGSGVPTISAAVKGSLYLRTDGSSVSTRMYVATDAVGGWTAVTTAT